VQKLLIYEYGGRRIVCGYFSVVVAARIEEEEGEEEEEENDGRLCWRQRK
jgi:hypothetical protein